MIATDAATLPDYGSVDVLRREGNVQVTVVK